MKNWERGPIAGPNWGRANWVHPDDPSWRRPPTSPDPRISPGREPVPANPATIAAIRRLDLEERQAFMEAASFIRPGVDPTYLHDGLEHYERSLDPVVMDALWRAAGEIDPNLNRGTRAYAARSRGERFNVIYRSLVTLDPPASVSAGGGLLTQLEGRAVPYSVYSNVGFYEEAHAPGSLDGYTGPASPPLPLKLNHGRDNPWPIGQSISWDSRADGLHGVWSLDDDDDAQRAARQAKRGAMGYLSIAFLAIRSDWDMHPNWDPLIGNLDRVTRTESRLTEVSVVDQPAFADARVTNVRSASTYQRHADRSPVAMFPTSSIAWRVEYKRLRRQQDLSDWKRTARRLHRIHD